MTGTKIEPCETVECAGGRERTRYFPRQLVTADDLTQDQRYHRDKQRRHNRMLHGWGVVCGARCRQDGACGVVIEAGYILGPQGDEIMIPKDHRIDVCASDLDGDAGTGCGEPDDPWCSDVRVGRRAGQTLYVAVRYAECHTRPVRGTSCGCGCGGGGGADCEYSRVRDSYALRVLTELPASHPATMTPPNWQDLFARPRPGRACLECPSDPWVVLADVRMSGEAQIERVDCFAHRRYVVSFAGHFMLGQP